MSEAPILNGVTTIANLEGASDFEKKHTPWVVTSRVDGGVQVRVKVGHEVAHPNQPDHYIVAIDIYANGVSIARASFSAVAVQPDVTFVLDVESGTALSAVELCNLHGAWGADFVAP